MRNLNIRIRIINIRRKIFEYSNIFEYLLIIAGLAQQQCFATLDLDLNEAFVRTVPAKK